MTVLASVAVRTAEANADLTSIGSAANLTIYSGTRPATPDAGLSSNIALVVLTWTGAAGTAANGVITFTAPPSNTAAASGTASWARLANSSGTAIFDFDVTATGGSGDIQVPTVSISAGVTITLTSLTLTEN